MAKKVAALADLTPDSSNANLGTERGRQALERSLRQFGAGRSVLADKHGNIIAGNKTTEVAAEIGLTVREIRTDGKELIVVVRDDLDLNTDVAARELAYADNRVAELDLAWDAEQIAADIEDGVSLVGLFTDDEINALLADYAEAVAEDDDEAEIAAAGAPPAVPRTKPGDLWYLGNHRLLCGDCRDDATVARLFGDARADLCVTSPPYADRRKYDGESPFVPIPPEGYGEWFRDVSRGIARFLAQDGSYFLNIKPHSEDGQRSLYVADLVLQHCRAWGWLFIDEFCWRNTRNGVPGTWPNRFKNAWEPVYQFAKQPGIKFRPQAVAVESDMVFDYSPDNSNSPTGSGIGIGAYKAGGFREGMALPSNVIEAAAETTQAKHSAPYPLALPAFFIQGYTDPGDIVYEPFCGSGTTLIAAELHERACYALEISPAYCDVIIARWEQQTGKQAELR